MGRVLGLLRRHGDNDGNTFRIDPVYIFPMAFLDQSQEPASMQGCLDGLFHLFFSISALYTVTISARFISAIAFFTSVGGRL